MLFVPADSDRFVAKAGQRGTDALILDLEDAVARPMKVAARANLAPFIERLRPAAVPLHVRVNNEPQLLADDVEAALVAGADGLLMPKVDTPEQMVELDLLLHRLEARHQRAPGGITVVALIESPLGLCNALPIARASRRLRGLLFGVEDFGAAMSMESHPEGMTGPAQTMATGTFSQKMTRQASSTMPKMPAMEAPQIGPSTQPTVSMAPTRPIAARRRPGGSRSPTRAMVTGSSAPPPRP